MIGTYNGKDGLVEVQLKTDNKTGLWARPGTSDQTMIREARFKDYSTIDCKGHVCLDLGGNVGGFILKAAVEGAKEVISYEPEPFNYAILEKNAQIVSSRYPNIKVTPLNKAVSGETGEFDLVISPGSNSPCSASLTNKLRGDRHSIKVQVDGIKEVLDRYRPTLIKMDIEGAEYEVLAEPFPEYVQELAIEFHGFTKRNRERMHETIARLQAQGWKMVDERSKKIFNVVSLITIHVKR